ncbi:hypothetical protein SAMN05421676_10124 [Salinibacillus kushneri]|uniref:Uncharacterized protein n=1 Tax=Salinibacillus kushneri TaxID=237682 RepID=A0A1H9Y4K4_9BACI|nr:hypothetical protein [Salinibacillus kushneri]SES63807.1 hypothetical protein SAMN05421676_10124 [Salinibacillus kushneri]
MKESRNWFPMPKKDAIFFIAIVLYVLLFFLPWTYEIKLLDISLVAWGGSLLFFLTPITGILVALSERQDKRK